MTQDLPLCLESIVHVKAIPTTPSLIELEPMFCDKTLEIVTGADRRLRRPLLRLLLSNTVLLHARPHVMVRLKSAELQINHGFARDRDAAPWRNFNLLPPRETH
jgi:hypothetical protein